MSLRHSRYSVGKRTSQSGPDKLGIQLVLSLILCACAVGCRLWYPSSVEAVSEVVFGQNDNAVKQVFLNLKDSVEDVRAAEVFADLYSELVNHIEG